MAAGYVAAFVAIVGAAASVYSSQQTASAQKKASNRSAEMAAAAASRDAADTAEQHKRIVATQEAMYGAAGLTMEGSPLLVKQTSLRESQEQLRRIEEGGANLSTTYRKEGSEAQAAGNIKAVGEGVKGAESIYNIGKNYDWFK